MAGDTKLKMEADIAAAEKAGEEAGKKLGEGVTKALSDLKTAESAGKKQAEAFRGPLDQMMGSLGATAGKHGAEVSEKLAEPFTKALKNIESAYSNIFGQSLTEKVGAGADSAAKAITDRLGKPIEQKLEQSAEKSSSIFGRLFRKRTEEAVKDTRFDFANAQSDTSKSSQFEHRTAEIGAELSMAIEKETGVRVPPEELQKTLKAETLEAERRRAEEGQQTILERTAAEAGAPAPAVEPRAEAAPEAGSTVLERTAEEVNAPRETPRRPLAELQERQKIRAAQAAGEAPVTDDATIRQQARETVEAQTDKKSSKARPPDERQKRGIMQTLLWGKQLPQEQLQLIKRFVGQTENVINRGLLQPLGLSGIGTMVRAGGMMAAGTMAGVRHLARKRPQQRADESDEDFKKREKEYQEKGKAGMGMRAGGFGLAASTLAAGAAKVIGFGAQEEDYVRQAAPLMGGGGRAGIAAAKQTIRTGARHQFEMGETAQMAIPMARAGLIGPRAQDQGALKTAMRAQRAYGMGGDVTALMAAQAQRGQRFEGTEGGQKSKQDFQKVIAAGMASGLQQGRWGEIARGLSQMTLSRGIGQRINVDEATKGMARISSAFKGMEAVQAIGSLENMARAPATPMARAAALQAAGLGRGGPGGVGANIFAAERKLEQGFFGEAEVPTWAGGDEEGKTKGLGEGGLKEMIGFFKERAGFGKTEKVAKEMEGKDELRRDMMIKQLSLAMQTSQTAVVKMLDAFEEGKGMDKLQAIIKEGKPLEQKAYEAMIEMSTMKDLKIGIQNALQAWWEVAREPVTDIVRMLTKLLAVVTDIAKAIPGFGGDDKEKEEKKAHDRQMTITRRLEKDIPKEQRDLAVQQRVDKLQNVLDKLKDAKEEDIDKILQAGGITDIGKEDVKRRVRGGVFAQSKKEAVEDALLRRQAGLELYKTTGAAPQAGESEVGGGFRELRRMGKLSEEGYEAVERAKGLTQSEVGKMLANVQKTLASLPEKVGNATENGARKGTREGAPGAPFTRPPTGPNIAATPSGGVNPNPTPAVLGATGAP